MDIPENKRRSPAFSFPWENRDPDLRKKGLELGKSSEKLFITEESTFKSNKYFLAIYIPQNVYIKAVLKVFSIFAGIFIGAMLLSFFSIGLSLLTIFLSIILTILGGNIIISKFFRVLDPGIWKNISGFAAFDSKKVIISDEDKLRELLPAARLALKLYFKPSVVQGKIPEIYENILDRLEDLRKEGEKKLKERKSPQTELEKELMDLNKEMFRYDFKIFKDRKRFESLKTKIHNLELSICEDFQLKIGEYEKVLNKLKDMINEFRDDLENRLNTYEKYLLKLEEKYKIGLRPSKFRFLEYSILAFFGYIILRSLEPFLVLSGEAIKYIFDYLAGQKKLKNSLESLRKIEEWINDDLKALKKTSPDNLDLRYHE